MGKVVDDRGNAADRLQALVVPDTETVSYFAFRSRSIENIAYVYFFDTLAGGR